MKKLVSAKEEREILSKNLNRLLKSKGKTQADVVRELGIPEATIRSWFSGEKYPRIQNIQKLADYFNVKRSQITEDETNGLERVVNLVKIPVLGVITCGEPITAEQNIDGYREEISDFLPTGNLFYLKTRGDSMVPTVPSNSYVLIREQAEVEDGEIAAVLVNGDEEATLKRVKYQDNLVLLIADNPNYDPYIVTENNPARILGKAIKFSVDL